MTNINKIIISEGLRNLGVPEGCVLIVHSSLSSLGYVDGGAETVVKAIMETIGKEGTLVVPTLTGNETLSRDNPPVFDVKNSKGLAGIIPEYVRKHPDSVRSLHPTHSVAAIGPLAQILIRDHIY